MKCGTLQAPYRKAFPFHCPAREVPPLEESSTGSGGNLQPEASCNIGFQIDSMDKLMKLQSLFLRTSLIIFSVVPLLCATRASAQSKTGTSTATVTKSETQAKAKPLPRDNAKLKASQEGPEFLRRRQDWFFKQRSFPIGFIPQGARERALQQRREMYRREGRLGFVTSLGFLPPPSGPTSAWTSIGPQPSTTVIFPPFISGRVTALAVNPNNVNNVYLGGADGGLWVSTDGGSNWTPLSDNPPSATPIPSVAVGAIAVDPTTCGAAPTGICTTVYVGTGEDDFGGDNVYGEGVLNCTVTAGPPPSAVCTQDTTFHTPSPLDETRGAPMIGALAVNRLAGNNNILLAAVRGRASAIVSGVWCSADKGTTWTRVLPTALVNGTGDIGTDVAFASDGTAWVALGFPDPATGNGIYKSTAPVSSCTINFSQQMLPASFTSGPTGNIGRITLALAPSNNADIYAAVADATTGSSFLLGVIRSTNANTATPTWTQLTDPLVSADSFFNTSFCSGQCFFDMALAVDPASPDVVYAGGSGAFPIIRTINGTTTTPSWAEIDNAGGLQFPHVDTHAFGFAGDGTRVYVGNDGGVWCTGTPSGTITWNNLNGSAGAPTGALNLTQFYPGISIHPATPLSGMGGAQDNDFQQYKGTPVWQSFDIGCDGGFTAIDLKIPSTLYGECEYFPNTGNPFFPVIAVNFMGDASGATFISFNFGIDNTDRGAFIPPLVMDKTNNLTLYFGTCRVYQTKDGANTWNPISPDVTTSTRPAPTTCPEPIAVGQPSASLSTIAPAPSDPNTIYVGSDEGEIEVTSNAGTSWTSIVTATLPTRSVTQVAVDPISAMIAYATFSGFGTCATFCSSPTGHVFKTVNGTSGAATWVDISGNLPDIPVNAIVIDPDNPATTLYVGTDIGAFFTTNAGVNWSPLGASASIPNAQILALALHEPSRTLRAATHGRGMWDINLGGQAAFGITSISPFTANAPSASITPFTVNGNGFTANSKIQFGSGVTLTPTTTSATQLTATIPAANLAVGAAVPVSVTDTTQVNPTNSVPFTILNPVPALTSSSPVSVTAGANPTGFVLTVNGSGFVCGTNGTAVLLDGTSRATATSPACSATSISAQVTPADQAVGHVFFVDVFSPQPGGGFELGPSLTLTINNPLPTLTSISPMTATPGGAAFTLTLTGSNFNASSAVFFNGNARATTFVSSTQLTASILASDIATAGTDSVIVNNPFPGGGTSASATFTVSSSGTFTVSGAAVTVAAGSSGMSAITVTPSGGFTGIVNVTCPAANLPPGVTCSPNPLAINITSASPVASNLTIAVAANSSSLSASVEPLDRHFYVAGLTALGGGKGWWGLSAVTGLAAILLLFLPGRKRYRAALALGLICVLSFTLGCGNNYGGGGGGPATTTTKLSVTSTKVASGTSIAFTVNVTSTGTRTPTGSVQLYDGTSILGTSTALSGGSATISISTLSVGTHAMINAHYLGDTYSQVSQSGNLSMAITGTTSVAITGTSGSTTANGTVSLTIN